MSGGVEEALGRVGEPGLESGSSAPTSTHGEPLWSDLQLHSWEGRDLLDHVALRYHRDIPSNKPCKYFDHIILNSMPVALD